MLANYTWSKSIDDLPLGQSISTVVSGGSSPIPWYLPGRHQFDRGPSDFDHTHRFVTSFVWDLPHLVGSPALVRYVVGGWQLSGLLTAQSGSPFTVTAGKDQSGTGLGTDRGVAVGSNVYGAGACGSSAPCVGWLNPAAFQLPAVGTYGTLGKNVFRGPDFFTYDGGLFKEIPLGRERVRLQFRAEFFNLFNRVNFYNPGASSQNSSSAAVISNAGFGTIKGSGDPRIGQLALKLLF